MSFFKKLFGINSETDQVKTEIPFEIKITTSVSDSTSTYEREKFKPIKKDNEGFYVLNPDAPFILTLLTKDLKIATLVRETLDDDQTYDYRKENKLVAVFAEHNLKIKEVEEYKLKYKQQYFDSIEKQKQNSSEWSSAGEKDKEDLLVDFRNVAISQLYERANCDLEVLFEKEPTNITLDDELIKEYGFESMQTYLKYADNIEKVRVAPNDSYNRPRFEKLVELDLAINGTGISKEEILNTLTLKELNTIAQAPDKEFKRKNAAIDYILGLHNLDGIIGKHISLRELFKLKALPEKYKELNLKEISDTWNYHGQEIKLLTDTFQWSYFSWRDLKDNKFVVNYKVKSFDNGCPCPKAQELAQKLFSKNAPPQIPYHIGCNCHIEKEHNFDR